jgi:hypothetical protein
LGTPGMKNEARPWFLASRLGGTGIIRARDFGCGPYCPDALNDPGIWAPDGLWRSAAAGGPAGGEVWRWAAGAGTANRGGAYSRRATISKKYEAGRGIMRVFAHNRGERGGIVRKSRGVGGDLGHGRTPISAKHYSLTSKGRGMFWFWSICRCTQSHNVQSEKY